MQNVRVAVIAIQYCLLSISVLTSGNGLFAADDQKPCADGRAYFRTVLAHASLLDRKDVWVDRAYEEKGAELLAMAESNPGCLLDALSDSEALSLLKALSRFEEKTTSTQMLLWDSFFEHYPRSSHLDEARWLRAKAESTPYEYEGLADAALQQIDVLHLFIEKNPTNRFISAAELELARAYRIAYEAIRYGGGLSTAPNENGMAAGVKYRDRATRLLRRLCADPGGRTRSEACGALRDLSRGICVYMGPGSPNPHSPDRWATPGPK